MCMLMNMQGALLHALISLSRMHSSTLCSRSRHVFGRMIQAFSCSLKGCIIHRVTDRMLKT